MLHQVGVGVLGPVFRTYEPTRDRLVAVKVFRLDITPEQAQSLADALGLATEAGLFHPSVVEPIAAGVEGTVAYRAEEYVAAESLDVAMRHYAPATIDKALPFITQLAGAIDFARTAGVGHGALHPRDIFVTPEESRATGFGVVEALERVGLRAPVRRPYSAPERVDGGEWGTPADVFSLAAITYVLLTGRRPAGTSDQIGPLTEFAGDHGDAIHAVLAQAMNEDPGRRFPTALSFASALEAAARGAETTQGAPAVSLGSSLGGGALVDDVIEDNVAAMPAPIDLDEHEEPAEVAIEEDMFRAVDEPAVDLALAAPLDRFTSEFDPTDIDEPAPVETLPVDDERDDDPPQEQEQEEERDEQPLHATLASSAFEPVEPAHPPRGYSSITDPVVVPDRPRTAILPHAIVGILALLLGFGAGYAYATRRAAQEIDAFRQSAAAASANPKGREFSEQAVATPEPQPQPQGRPAAEPPRVPGESPAPAPAPAAPPAATRTPATGSITITSTPTRAGVSVDGKWRGRTPLTLDKLAFGSHTIRIIQDGYRVDQHVVPLSAQSPSRTVAAKLQRLPGPAAPAPAATAAATPATGPGSLYVDSRPRGARVMLDEKFVGVTPLQLPEVPAGRHAVRLELADHQPWRTTATIISGRDNRVTGSLERIR